jgi:tetratricopeptide (TPR) repeat protein
MANRLVLCAIASAALAAPASASVIALGSSAARMCYEAADSPMYPTPDSLRRCDDALEEGTLTAHEIGATYVNRGILHMRRGHVDRAIADFDAALRVDPNQPEAYLNKGAALLRMEGNESQAAELFTVALQRNTIRPAVAHFGRAVAHEAMGDFRAAYDDYRAASQLDPRWRLPRTELQRFRLVSR